MIDVGKKVVSFNIKGFLASQTIYFLLILIYVNDKFGLLDMEKVKII